MPNQNITLPKSFDREVQGSLCAAYAPIVKYRKVLELTKKRVGSPCDNWQAKIANGESATSNFYASREKVVFIKGKISARFYAPTCAQHNAPVYDTYCGLDPVKASTAANAAAAATAQNNAAIGIRNKIKSESQSFSGPTVLGELRETIRMIRKPAATLRDYSALKFKMMRNQNKRYRASKWREIFSDLWLEYSFGAAPLIKDITEIANAALYQADVTRIKRLSYTGHGEHATSSTVSGGGLLGYLYQQEAQYAVHTRYIVGYRVRAEGPKNALQRLISLGGFNLNEVIPTAWELLPFSFLLDYFSTIGSVLNTTLVSTDDLAWTCKTDRVENKLSVHSGKIIGTSDSAKDPSGMCPRFYATFQSITRSSASIPFGELAFRLPGSEFQFLNLAALLTSGRPNIRRS